MTAFLLREELKRKGVALRLQGNRLLLTPQNQTPPTLFSHIQSLKPQLVEMLQIEERAALERCPEHARVFFSRDDQIAIGRNLLRLDSGQDIEEQEATTK